MFELIKAEHKNVLNDIAVQISNSTVSEIADRLHDLIEQVGSEIPAKKKISYGRYSIIKYLGLEFYPILMEDNIEVFSFAKIVFEDSRHDQFVRAFAIQLISLYGLEKYNLQVVLQVFEKAAINDLWEIRECSAGFIRKLIKQYPDEMKDWYILQSESENPLIRRFASESIRPVADNRWFRKNPDFCFSVIEKLYSESSPYPRTSVGNNLSDWSRIDKEKIFRIVENLVATNNKNSYWIAYRACRNLVKTEPPRVMDLLKVDEYKYKKRIHKREDYT